jgi:hypothetical protein
VTFFAYRPPSRPQGSLTPTQPGRVTNPTQGHPGGRLGYSPSGRVPRDRSGVSPSHRPSTGSCYRARSGSTAGPGQWLPSAINPLFRRAGSIAPPLGPPERALELSNGTGLYGACRSTQSVVCLALWSCRCFMGGVHSTRLSGFALERSKRKKTAEARATLPKSEQLELRSHQPWNYPRWGPDPISFCKCSC